jgi:hypothetical protein
MLIDERLTFAWDEAPEGSAGTTVLGDVIDLTEEVDQGEGYPLYLVIKIGTATAGGTSIDFQLITADNAALSSGDVTLYSTGAIATAAMTAGATVAMIAIPKADYKRYLGMKITEVGTFSAGTIKAFITQDPPAWRAYPEGNN